MWCCRQNNQNKRLQRLCQQRGWCRVPENLYWICLFFSPLDFKDQLPFLLQLGPFTFAPPSLTKHIMVQIKFYWCKSSFSSYSIRWAVETDSRMQRLAPFPEERSRDLTLNSELVPLLVHFWAFFLRVTLSGQIFSSTPRPDDSYLSQW